MSVCRCGQCGLIFADPQPVPPSLHDHYNVPPEQYWRSVPKEIPEDYFASQIAVTKRLLNFSSGMKALDIGAGLGQAIAQMNKAGFDAYGIEPSRPFREEALRRTGLPAERVQLSGVEEAEFEAESFHFITFGAVLEHLYDPASCIERAIRWLKPGGLVHAEVPNAEHLVSKLLNTYFAMIGSNFVTNLSPMHSPYHLYEFSLKSFEQHGLKANYSVAEHNYEVATIYNVPKVLHSSLRRIMERNDSGMQLSVWLRKNPE